MSAGLEEMGVVDAEVPRVGAVDLVVAAASRSR